MHDYALRSRRIYTKLGIMVISGKRTEIGDGCQSRLKLY